MLDATIEIGTVLKFGLMTAGLFALIYFATVATPWLAKHVDRWLADYRANHDPKKDPTYGVRSIYELPPKQDNQDNTDDDTHQKGKHYGEK